MKIGAKGITYKYKNKGIDSQLLKQQVSFKCSDEGASSTVENLF